MFRTMVESECVLSDAEARSWWLLLRMKQALTTEKGTVLGYGEL